VHCTNELEKVNRLDKNIISQEIFTCGGSMQIATHNYIKTGPQTRSSAKQLVNTAVTMNTNATYLIQRHLSTVSTN